MPLKNSKGQMAIFFVFIFQILFILFAMTLNVALVVHDKINLQNSLDLAAMYGAKKQAEVLNVISHINYQMRQNYKLLAWRYRILGSVTRKESSSPSRKAWCPTNRGGDNLCVIRSSKDYHPCRGSIYPNYCDMGFAVCINTPIWNKGRNNDPREDHPESGNSGYCNNQGFKVAEISTFTPIFPIPMNRQAAKRQKELKDNIEDICANQQGLSWLMTQMFVSHFRVDQKDRKSMIQAIYNETLKKGKDLDGHVIAGGVEKVLRKNLNYTNLGNYKTPIFFNSFQNKNFKDFLKPLNIFPILSYMDLNEHCSGRSHPHIHNENPSVTMADSYKNLFQYNYGFSSDPYDPLATLTLGYKKNPELTLYYGLKAEFSYNSLVQLFSPDPSKPLLLKASSFAKPFGGRIGPDERADPILKPQIDFLTSSQGLSKIAGKNIPYYNLQANYSRYPGDQWGLIDRKLHDPSLNSAFLKKEALSKTEDKTPYSLGHFDHLNIIERADPLAFPRGENSDSHFLRIMELMAVFPDTFDIIHYSISNNYMETYFPKICKLIGSGGECKLNQRTNIRGLDASIRGDFGYPDSGKYLQRNLQTTKIANSFIPFFYAKDKSPVNLSLLRPFDVYTSPNTHYEYLISDPAHLLTSWVPPTQRERYSNYSFPEKMFAKCYTHTGNSSISNLLPIPSGCSKGGRSGYSIKMVSCDLVKTFQPQPNNLQAFCP